MITYTLKLTKRIILKYQYGFRPDPGATDANFVLSIHGLHGDILFEKRALASSVLVHAEEIRLWTWLSD